MHFDILTLFPDLVHHYASESILGRAQEKKLISIQAHNFRDFTLDKQHHVDDHPYGGGPGMVLQVQPIYDCLKAICALNLKVFKSVMPAKAGIQKRGVDSRLRGNGKSKIIIMDPAGKKFDQRLAEKFAKLDRLVLIAGRYEGFDARIYKLADERISVGEYVLAGGELPALTIIEAVSRLIPGVLGNSASLDVETFSNHESRIKNKGSKMQKRDSLFVIRNSAKEHPHYTRPPNFMGMKVPAVLLSGDHKKIDEWRKKQSK